MRPAARSRVVPAFFVVPCSPVPSLSFVRAQVRFTLGQQTAKPQEPVDAVIASFESLVELSVFFVHAFDSSLLVACRRLRPDIALYRALPPAARAARAAGANDARPARAARSLGCSRCAVMSDACHAAGGAPPRSRRQHGFCGPLYLALSRGLA